jgi:hypothetical protein
MAIFQAGRRRHFENSNYIPILMQFGLQTEKHMLRSKNAKTGSTAIFQDGSRRQLAKSRKVLYNGQLWLHSAHCGASGPKTANINR